MGGNRGPRGVKTLQFQTATFAVASMHISEKVGASCQVHTSKSMSGGPIDDVLLRREHKTILQKDKKTKKGESLPSLHLQEIHGIVRAAMGGLPATTSSGCFLP